MGHPTVWEYVRNAAVPRVAKRGAEPTSEMAVAKLEKHADMYLGSPRRYNEALGGSLENAATLPDARITINNHNQGAAASTLRT
jgi:hypothetical protein